MYLDFFRNNTKLDVDLHSQIVKLMSMEKEKNFVSIVPLKKTTMFESEVCFLAQISRVTGKENNCFHFRSTYSIALSFLKNQFIFLATKNSSNTRNKHWEVQYCIITDLKTLLPFKVFRNRLQNQFLNDPLWKRPDRMNYSAERQEFESWPAEYRPTYPDPVLNIVIHCMESFEEKKCKKVLLKSTKWSEVFVSWEDTSFE